VQVIEHQHETRLLNCQFELQKLQREFDAAEEGRQKLLKERERENGHLSGKQQHLINELNETIHELGNRHDIETLELQRQANAWRDRFLKMSKRLRLISHDNKMDSVEQQSKLNAIRKALLARLDEARNSHKELLSASVSRDVHDRRITELNEHHTLNVDRLVSKFRREIADLQDRLAHQESTLQEQRGKRHARDEELEDMRDH